MLWQLSETTASVDDGDLAAADQFTCNALDYKVLFTLNKTTAMFNISILTEGKQRQRFNIWSKIFWLTAENRAKSTSLPTDGSQSLNSKVNKSKNKSKKMMQSFMWGNFQDDWPQPTIFHWINRFNEWTRSAHSSRLSHGHHPEQISLLDSFHVGYKYNCLWIIMAHNHRWLTSTQTKPSESFDNYLLVKWKKCKAYKMTNNKLCDLDNGKCVWRT